MIIKKQAVNSANALSTADAGVALLPLLRRILLGDLTASLLHDLNNPLTAILNYARLLQMGQFQREESEAFAKSIVGEGERIAAMTNRLRALAADGCGAKLREALTLALDLCQTRFRYDGIAVELPAGPNLPNTKLSLAGLLQMILPLLEKARQALNSRAMTPESEKMLRCILTESANCRQRLTLTHNGISSPEAGLNFLSPLFSNSRPPEQSKIAEELTQALLNSFNCKIAVEPTVNGWTALHLDIPAE
jgi:C4-dicarboxylate-specific signal transduction histidine kinase